MQQFEIDWYRDLLALYVNGGQLSGDDMHRLHYLRNRYAIEVEEPLAEPVERIRVEVK